MENANNILFRCSSLGYIMTEPRSKSEVLSETCKTHLVDVFVSAKYGRRTDIQTRYTIKGNLVEEDSMTLYSRVTGKFYRKNKETFKNDFISGTPDIITLDGAKPERIIDIKSSWDIFTFFRTCAKEINKNYYWQLMGYMALTGAETSNLAYCLVNTPDALIEAEKRRLWYSMGQPEQDNREYIEGCLEIDRMMIYDDIPMKERVMDMITVDRDEDVIQRIYARVAQCREWMDTNLFKTTPSREDVEGIAQERK